MSKPITSFESASLLPCPFCGEQPNRRTHYADTGGGDGKWCFVIECANNPCGVKVYSAACGPHGYRQDGDLKDNEAAARSAIDNWNKRILKT